MTKAKTPKKQKSRVGQVREEEKVEQMEAVGPVGQEMQGQTSSRRTRSSYRDSVPPPTIEPLSNQPKEPETENMESTNENVEHVDKKTKRGGGNKKKSKAQAQALLEEKIGPMETEIEFGFKRTRAVKRGKKSSVVVGAVEEEVLKKGEDGGGVADGEVGQTANGNDGVKESQNGKRALDIHEDGGKDEKGLVKEVSTTVQHDEKSVGAVDSMDQEQQVAATRVTVSLPGKTLEFNLDTFSSLVMDSMRSSRITINKKNAHSLLVHGLYHQLRDQARLQY
ncbi:hypothetical protein HDU76_001605 [Blyttiomyces sp. JEL0837]|nr:hypothetical protein HDU76_001605 [Blyttiomyces sp. JEL0837]